MEPSWVESFYEALEFFYWEPQHIGRRKYADADFDSIDKVKDHLRRMEVTLNQNLQQFFLLAPQQIRRGLLSTLFERHFGHDLVMYGRAVDGELELMSSMQPDLLFVSDREVAAIEMKIGAKCSVEQVLKYALLGLAVELRVGEERDHHLALLGSGNFVSQWTERFASIDALKLAVAAVDSESFLGGMPARFRDHKERFKRITRQLRLAYINYGSLGDYLKQAMPPLSDHSPGAEVLRKLITGVVEEFRVRQL
jgi:hypothetical protein